MKKLFMLAALVAVSSLSFAQEVSFGAKAGANLANISYSGDGTDDIESKMRTSFHIGGMAEIELSEFISLQPELLFSAQGNTNEYDVLGTTVKTTTMLNYINLPIMGKFYVAEGFALEVGPQVGFLMSAKAKGESGDDSSTTDIKESFNGIDFGLNAGLSYKLESGLSFGARYNFGFANLAKEAEGNFKAKNSVIQVSVGYFFN